ncbi:hypothetical protein ACIGBH_41905 [Streptomyces sp. NPDC085929]|uniref:hypothetical protein n=1 Tax=Streptomyces sp. NPDC085929 TaxID=3365739 RepID=UPI0037CE931C
MTGRQRRVGGSVLAGTVLAVCGWWADRLGYEAVGLFLSSSAGAVVLAGTWRAGALYPQPAPLAPDTALPRRFSARQRADRERSVRLLKAIDKAVADGTRKPGELSEFERIVLHGVVELPGREYPPAGHGYPHP